MNNSVVGAALAAFFVTLLFGTEILVGGLLPVALMDEAYGMPDWLEYGLDGLVVLLTLVFCAWFGFRAFRLERGASICSRTPDGLPLSNP